MPRYIARTFIVVLLTLLSVAGCGDSEKSARQYLSDQGCTVQEMTDLSGGRFAFEARCKNRACSGSVVVNGDSLSSTMSCSSDKLKGVDSSGKSGDPTTPKTGEPCTGATNCAQVANAARAVPTVGADWKLAAQANLIGCKAGDAEQCAQAGHAFRNGYGIEDDIELAGKLLEKACKGGHAASCGWHARFLFENKDGKGALKVGRENCAKNIGSACGVMGLVQVQGIGGVPVKMDAGIAGLKKGCELKDAWSCTTFGNVMNKNNKGPLDLLQAGNAYSEGCQLGNGRACGMLETYAKHYDTIEEFKVSAGYRKDLCELGHPASCSQYGYNLRNGHGVAKNAEEALIYFTMACKWGDALGCANQGDMDKRAAKPGAIEKLAHGCNGNVQGACDLLLDNSAMSIAAAEKSEVVRSALGMACMGPKDTLATCRKICKSSGLTCEYLGASYPEGSTERSSVSADFVRHLEAGCAKSIAWACDGLGYQYRVGEHGLKKDRSKGLSLSRKSCQLGNQEACFNLADNLDDDPKTYDESVKLLESTCLAGHATACGSLGTSLINTQKQPIDIKRGLALLLQRCDKGGNSVGYCESAGKLLLYGAPEVPADVRAAFAAFRKGCVAGNNTACKALMDRNHRPFPLANGATDNLPFDL